MRRAGALLLLLAAVGVMPNAGAQVEPPPSRPNILIILTDDQRAGLPKTMPVTKNWFQNNGRKFWRAFASTPLCCPARASLMSGRYAHNHGVTSNTNAANFDLSKTMQRYLLDAGYRTGIVGKFLNGWDVEKDPPFWSSWSIARGGYFSDREWNFNGTLNTEDTYYTTMVRRRSLRFLREAEVINDDQPWLLYVAPFAPHGPNIPERKYADLPVRRWDGNPAVSERDLSDKPPWWRQKSCDLDCGNGIRRKQIRTLASVDDMIAAMRDAMNQLGEQDTLAIFMSDNGYMWFEHTLDAKRHAYDESVKIPMFVRWPGHVAAGGKDFDTVGNIDVASTIYEATGVSPSYTPDGRSLFAPGSRRYLLAEHWKYGTVPTWQGLWSPGDVFVRHAGGFREYYSADDSWQLLNIYKDGVTGNEPSGLDQLLTEQIGCRGSSCL